MDQQQVDCDLEVNVPFTPPHSVPNKWLPIEPEQHEVMSVLALDAKVKYMDDSGNGIIEVGELVWFLEVIQVHNPSDMTWTNTIVKDRWGAELDVESATPLSGTAVLTTKGKSAKEFLEWQIGDLGPGETANLVLRVHTDLNPAGHQQYTSPGEYEYNSGAVVKFLNEAGKQRSFETGSVFLTVVP